MTSADEYRLKAAEFSAKAQAEQSPELQIEYARMAAAYLLLAEHAKRSAETGWGFELLFGPKSIAP